MAKDCDAAQEVSYCRNGRLRGHWCCGHRRNGDGAVLIHLVGWWIFTTSSLATERRRPQEPGLWSRIRKTQAGFQWFHGALVGVTVVTLMAVAHHDFLVNESHINWIRNAFYYSSVMHITMSMFPPWLTRLFGARAPAAT